MELKGKITQIFELQIFNSNFKKREIVLTTDEEYPQNILIEFIQEKTDLLSFLKVNDYVIVYINIRGREWLKPEGGVKYFNSIQGWRIDKLSPKKEFVEKFDDIPF